MKSTSILIQESYHLIITASLRCLILMRILDFTTTGLIPDGEMLLCCYDRYHLYDDRMFLACGNLLSHCDTLLFIVGGSLFDSDGLPLCYNKLPPYCEGS